MTLVSQVLLCHKTRTDLNILNDPVSNHFVGTGITAASYCGGYKSDGSGLLRDALIIPSLSTANGAALKYSNVCGKSGFADNNSPPGTIATVCSKF